jgi:septal ring factor EnvC (AmiA/AmiB activator)
MDLASVFSIEKFRGLGAPKTSEKETLMKRILIFSLNLMALSAAFARPDTRDDTPKYKYKRQNPDDVRHKAELLENYNRAMLLRDHAKNRNDKAQSDLVAQERKLRDAQTNLSHFKEEFSDKLNEVTSYKRKVNQATLELEQNIQLQALLEALLSPSGREFISIFSDLIKNRSLDQKIDCSSKPTFSEDNEFWSLNFKTGCSLLSNEVEKWKFLEVPLNEAIHLSPVLQSFVAIQSQDISELDRIFRKLELRKDKYKSLLIELKNSSEEINAIALKLIELENQERQINNELDGLKSLLKTTLAALASAEDSVTNSKREYDSFEVRIETYDG